MSIEVKQFSVSIASNTTLTSQVDLGKAYDKVVLEIPTMPSGCDIFLQGASSDGGTFRRIYNAGSNPDTTPLAVQFDSSITNCFVETPAFCRYMKVELSASGMSDNSATFNFVCID